MTTLVNWAKPDCELSWETLGANGIPADDVTPLKGQGAGAYLSRGQFYTVVGQPFCFHPSVAFYT